MKKSRAADLERLQSDVEWALEKGLGPRDLIPMLERLRAHAPRGSTAACFAGLELSEVLLATSPWRSAILSREVLCHEDTDRTWAVLGLALALLGHYRSARNAFAKAVARAPSCASYAHNLGHILDAGLDRPAEALPWLTRAFRGRPDDAEIAASYAHALVRVGREPEARQVLVRALGPDAEITAEELLDRWLGKRVTPALPAP